MAEKVQFIPGRLKSSVEGGYVTGARDIIDDKKGKNQEAINEQVAQDISDIKGGGSDSIKTLKDAITKETTDRTQADNAERAARQEADNTLNGRITSTEADLDNKIQQEATTRSTSDGNLQSQIDVLRALYEALTESDIVIVENTDWPLASGEPKTIYRVTNWDGTQVAEAYTDYMYYDGQWFLMATYSNGVDEVPTEDSGNLVKSGGVYSAIKEIGYFEESPQFIKVELDADEKIIKATKEDGTEYFGADIENQSAVVSSIDHPEFIQVAVSGDKILWGVQKNGNFIFGTGVPSQVITYINQKIEELSLDEYEAIVEFIGGLEYDTTLQQLLDKKADGEYTQDEQYIQVITDSEDKVLEGIQEDGTKAIQGPLKALGKLIVQGVEYEVISNAQWIAAWIDNQGKILAGINTNGKFFIGDADFIKKAEISEEFIKTFFDEVLSEEYSSVEVDDNYRILGGRKNTGIRFENAGLKFKSTELDDLEDKNSRLQMTLDEEEKILSYRTSDGMLHEPVGVFTNKLQLSNEGMTDFQQALKDAGFQPGGGGDFSDAITEKGKKPVYIPMPRLARINIHWDGDLTQLSKSDRPDGVQKVNYDVKVLCEFFDGQGIYFKKWALMSAQGNSSMSFIEKNISLKFFDTENVENAKGKWGKGDTFGTVFGDWVMQKTYHLKAYYTDFLKGSPVVALQLANEVYKTRGVFADRPWKKALIDFSKILSTTPAGLSEDGIDDMNLQIDNGARCMPDGFPVIVYQNGEFYGIFCWQLKKDSDNFNLDTGEAEHVHIDGALYTQYLWNGYVEWTAFEIRNPEDLICMDGSDYDGDHPAELIDESSPNWDGTNKKHKKSAKVKGYIQDLSTRVNQIRNLMTVNTPRPGYETMEIGEYWGAHNLETNYPRQSWVHDDTGENFYMCIKQTDVVGTPLTDTEHWLDITQAILTIRATIETYFDVDNLIDYEVINMVVGDPDGFGKNWQWCTYDGVKWWVNQYDKDMSFGNHFIGTHTTAPRRGFLGYTITQPVGLAIRFYRLAFKTRWDELVNKGIFTSEHVKGLISAWVARVGKDNYEQNWKKWPEAPCNRDSKIDYEYWKFTGNTTSDTPESGLWDAATSYIIGDKVWYQGGGTYYQFEAVKAGSDKPCLTGAYPLYPNFMGYRDNVWRYYKYIDETMANQNSFINTIN